MQSKDENQIKGRNQYIICAKESPNSFSPPPLRKMNACCDLRNSSKDLVKTTVFVFKKTS